ncbi:hypothetical protein [Streptomyces phage Psst1]|nr:hypothetical protein [Streptomyces phage Psst1]WPJ30668.1 hypothetical protein [Streptomyces phage Psst2]
MIELFTKLVWAAIGAAAGYYVAKRQLHDHYEARLSKATEDMEYFFKEKYDAKLQRENLKEKQEAFWDRDDAAVIEDPFPSAADSDEDESDTGYSEGLLSSEASEALTNYQGISAAPSTLAQELAHVGNVARKKVEEAITIDEEAKEAEELDTTFNPPEPGPRLINFSMYDQNEPNYAQTTVVYFKDGVVVDEHDEKVSEESVKKHIGDYNLEQCGEHRPTIYVRNDRFKMDFEVVWDRNTYEASVLGKKG